MSVEERHLLNKIRFFEDMLLRSKDYRQQENIGKELTVMRIRLQKLRFNKMRTGLSKASFFLLISTEVVFTKCRSLPRIAVERR